MKTMYSSMAVVLALAVAGCSMIKGKSSFSAGAGTGDANGTGTSTAGGGGGGDGGGGGGGGPDWIEVPDLNGKTFDEAVAIAKKLGFRTAPENTHAVACVEPPKVEEGQIDCQDPEPRKRVRNYTMIKVNVWKPQRLTGILVRAQLATLRGLTVEQAKAQLKKLGHDGPVRTDTVLHFDKDCGYDKVCGTSNSGGMGIHDECVLYLNKKNDIAAPPPE